MSNLNGAGKLFLIPCPIHEGANHTLSPEVLEAVKSTQCFLVENLRSARRFISSLKLGIDISSCTFHVMDKSTKREEVFVHLRQVGMDSNIGVISEAGCPGVADPGAVAVSIAHELGRQVIPLVGPSSILLALMASGFSGQQFTFHGYLPIKGPDLKKRLQNLESKALRESSSEIFMETPFRNDRLFAALLEHLNPRTRLCVACDLTAGSGWVFTKRVSDWKKKIPSLHKLPTVFLLSA